MTAQTFVHLRIHSEHSLVDGLVRVKPLIKRVVELGMPAVGLTEQSNMFSLVRFYKAALGAGVKPIIGADLWLENPDEPESPFRTTLLASNNDGYLNLTEIVSLGYTEGQRFGKPIIKREWLEARSQGLIMLSGGKMGDVAKAMLSDKPKLARDRACYWRDLYPGSFYLELQRTGRAGDEDCLHLNVELAAELGLPVVATNDVHFIYAEDFEAHEARVCIGESRTLDDPRRDRRFSDQQHLRSSEEMIELFADIPEAVENTLAIARRCSVTVRMGEYFLPNYPVPEGLTMDDYFRQVSEEGLEDRLAKTLPKDDPDYDNKRQAYYDRLKFELDIIIQMGFPGYFLIVMDFIKWAKNNGVPVGPGRGSGAGSLVAYAQLITDLDPLQYDLLFERFLNPERVSMPDFDVDFCMEGRDRVIAYVAEKYGREAVSQIITFGTMAAKAVVRDVARVQGKSYGLADKLSKMIPFEVGMTLAKAVEQEPSLKEFLAQDEEAQEIWEMAIKLEGVCRNAGKHAGGVVIAPTKITDFSPLYCDDDGGSLVTQFDKNDVEDAGLVKFDFLGLRTLTIIDWALKMINPRREKRGLKPVDISEIPLDDPASFVMLKKAETTAVFQLESRGMKDLIRRLQPDSLEDMIALVALFRPGPLQSGMVDDFIDRKHGKQPMSFPHPDYQYEGLKPVLEPTYGVILYQEQVMQIAQVMGGYSLGNADMLRRAMGKKKPEEMAKQKQFFLDGCAGNNIDKTLAENIFDLVEKFAGYGFNKSHSAAYALVSYQTLWLKAHYTAEFMAAVLTADMQNTDKVVTLVEECRSLKLDLVLPDVSTSEYAFTANDDGQVVYGLGAIKGLGEGPIDSIVTARKENGPFTDLFDFCRRVDLKKVNKRALEAMIRAGAMDTLGAGRAQLMASIGKAILQAGQQSRNEAAGMVDMFGDTLETAADVDAYIDVADIREWSEKQRLKGEKDTLGLYLTGHPFDEYEREVRRFVRSSIADLKPNKSPQRVAGLVVAQRTMKTRTGSTMCFITLDDRSGRIEATLFSEAFFENRELLQSDQVIVVEGQVSHDDYSGQMKMRVNSVMDVASARQQFSRGLQLKLNENQLGNGLLDSLEQLLAPHRCEGSPVWIEYTSPAASTRIELGSSWRVEPNDSLLLELKYLVGDRSVELVYD
ncbi:MULTISPECIES: DNA polymerase III subunit alpha [unclassified Marinobacter]|uniref:DNA polymerase III subunit alpha n=1 Tax=unclassified Marinobacter TaxID=83889 RepID=UPI000BF380D2|nr:MULTISPECIES: DNA polymerase III subunit alpha [unclassified Marinobacter]PFG08095.1 DNA polymerase III alpha subunit [Marinobacter sp. LV10MA510-1]PFG53913.1 DNA polymerase III alpha subunit [Marinobacter sp. LV10R520-4]